MARLRYGFHVNDSRLTAGRAADHPGFAEQGMVYAGRPVVPYRQLRRHGREIQLPQEVSHQLIEDQRRHPAMDNVGIPLMNFGWRPSRRDPLPVTIEVEGQMESLEIARAAAETHLVIGQGDPTTRLAA